MEAYVRVTLQSETPLEVRVDKTGVVMVSLQPGDYVMSVTAPGFKKWSTIVKIEAGKKQKIVPQLDIGEVSWGPVVEAETIPVEPSNPLADIAYLPLETVALPSHRVRQRRLWGSKL